MEVIYPIIRDFITEAGFKFEYIVDIDSPLIIEIIPAGLQSKAKFEYDAANSESSITLYFILEELDVDLTLKYKRSF